MKKLKWLKNQSNPQQRNIAKSFETVFDHIKKNDIGFYDLREVFFNKKNDPLFYFNFMASRPDKGLLKKRYGHLDEKGYEEVTKIIHRVIKN